MKATVCCGLLMGIEVVEVAETNITIWVGIKVELTPSWLALARTLVMRMIRVLVVPGGSIGTPSHTIWFAPD